MVKRFVIVDDHPIFRQGLVTLIETNSVYEVVAEAGSIKEALDLVEQFEPDIILVDITLEKQNGLELVKVLQKSSQIFPILVISMHDETVFAERAIDAGALGYVMKHAPPDTILEAIATVLSGKIYLSENMQHRILEARFGQSQSKPNQLIDRLTRRELEVLQYIGQGFGATEMANTLNLSVKTIHTHREHLKEKLNMDSSNELRKYAIKWYLSVTSER